MKHLINAALKYEELPDDAIPDSDGIECLTDFSPFVPKNRKVVSAHLPFCTDWYGIWSGKRGYLGGFDDSSQNYVTYGRSCGEIVENLSKAISAASEIRPSYAILHASSANFDELFDSEYSETSEEVLLAFCDIMNSVRDSLGGMPVRLMFENQWWPGLRFVDEREYSVLEENLDFDDWGFCLDTGHLLITSKRAGDEKTSVNVLMEYISKIPVNIRDRIEVVHLHYNDSVRYMREFDSVSADSVKGLDERIRRGYSYIAGMDRHLPFTIPECRKIIDAINPEFVVHEMGATVPEKKISDYLAQRSLFVR